MEFQRISKNGISAIDFVPSNGQLTSKEIANSFLSRVE